MKRASILIGCVPFLLIQAVLGSSPETILLSGCSILIGFLPLLLFGRDLYAVLAAIFALRYAGIALIAKTLYGQSLESNLHDPLAAYFYSFGFLATVTAILMTVRYFDRGRSFDAGLTTQRQFGRAAALAAFIGIIAQAVVIASISRRTGTANTGGAYVIAAHLSHLYLFALALECRRSLKSGGRLIGARLGIMLLLGVFLTMLLNAREFFADCLIVAAVTFYLHRALTWRHIAVGGAILIIGSTYLSPMVLAVRDLKYGRTTTEFVSLAADVVVRSVTDPAYREGLIQRQKAIAYAEKNALLYDYYGDGSNLLNRLSYVALADAVINAAQGHDPIGGAAFDEVKERVVPGFLVSDKRPRPYEYGDWLCWKLGLMDNGRIYAANFGLPMEGYAVAGPAGFLLFPFLFMLPAMLLITRVASFRVPTALGIFLFATFQHPLVEAASDGFINLVTRALPILAIASVLICRWASVRVRSRSAYSAASLTG